MIPIRDENRSRTTPHITRILIIANMIAFIPYLYFAFFPEKTTMLHFESLYYNYAMVPAHILQARSLHTLFTSMFLHADIFHIAGNMLNLP